LGAQVTWHDVSRGYQQVAMRRAEEHGVKIAFSLGYMDDAPSRICDQFDLVFNRICWYYGRGDASFAKVVYAMVKPGGVGYVDTMHSVFKYYEIAFHARERARLNDLTVWKIGHICPPRGRVARELLKYPMDKAMVDYGRPSNDRVVFRKAR